MFTLFLDTASREPVIALCDDEKTIALRSFEPRSDAAVVPAIEEALKEASLTYSDLTHLACATGPGGFSSLRIGLTAINTLAFALELPSAGVHLSDLWYARVGSPREDILWLHSTRKTQLFVRGFGGLQRQYPEPTLITIKGAATLDGSYVGELIEEHKKILSNGEPPKELKALDDVLPKLLKSLEYRKQLLQPWYGREG